MSEEKQKRHPWLAVLTILVIVLAFGQAAYIFYVQRQVVKTLNGVYGELAASPELNALLDLGTAVSPQTQEPTEQAPQRPSQKTPAEATAPQSKDLSSILGNLGATLGQDSSEAVNQLLDMTRQLAATIDESTGRISPSEKAFSKTAPVSTEIQLPNVNISETGDRYRVTLDFGTTPIDNLKATTEGKTLHVQGEAVTGAPSKREAKAGTAAATPFNWTLSFNEPLNGDSLALQTKDNVYTITVKKDAMV